MTVTFHWPTIVGLLGMLVTLAAYYLLQVRKLHGNGFIYQLMNAVGSAAMALEVAWLAISIYGMVVARRVRVQ